MKQKSTFKLIFAGTAIILVILPFAATASSFLTGVFDRSGWYKPIQEHVVPF